MKVKRIAILLCLAFIFTALFSGCTTISTSKARDNSKWGIRVYPPAVYMVVTDNEIAFVFLPDYSQGYDIKPISFLAKNKFSVGLAEGQVIVLSSDEDSTAFIEFMGKVLEATAKTAATAATKALTTKEETVPTNVIELKYCLGIEKGIYRLNENGGFIKINIPEKN